MPEKIKLTFNEIKENLEKILVNRGFSTESASLSARLFTETTQDGVYSHGLNRFPRYIDDIKRGYIKPDKSPSKVSSFGHYEIWDGNLGPGNLNAFSIMKRAIELAKEHKISIIGLRNTNHWLRGGTYGWQAADANCAAICFTNTIPNMPPWGAAESKVGNNPLIISVPDKNGHVVLDMAMSQFAFGKMEILKREGKKLPFEGGYNKDGKLTKEPEEILESNMALPMGFWKGSGLSMMLDLLATLLSEGRSSADIGELQGEYGLSQVFIVLDLETPEKSVFAERIVSQLKQALKEAKVMKGNDEVFYPGQKTLRTRKENQEEGIPVDKSLWEQILKLLEIERE
jgi:3-dehydro-L-gulonate 2-dehydrogenase